MFDKNKYIKYSNIWLPVSSESIIKFTLLYNDYKNRRLSFSFKFADLYPEKINGLDIL